MLYSLRTFLNIFINLNIYTFSYYLVYYLKRDELHLNQVYLEYFAVYLASWFISSVLSGKFFKTTQSFRESSRSQLTSIFLMIAFISISANVINLAEVSRILVLGSLLLSIILEFFVLHFRTSSKEPLENLIHVDFNIGSFIREIVLLVVALLLSNLFYFEGSLLSETNLLIHLGIFISWIIAAAFSFQFVPFDRNITYIKLFWKYFKSYIILNILSAFLVFSLRIDLDEQFYYVGFVGSYTILSWITLTVIYLYKRPGSSDEVQYKILKATEPSEVSTLESNFKENYLYKVSENHTDSDQLTKKLQTVFLKKFPQLFDFINRTLDLKHINEIKTAVLRSSDPYNVEILPDEEMHLYLNLHEVNDMRRLNSYFIEVNKCLMKGGVYIGKIEPVRNRHNRFKQKYPHYIAQLLYFFDFIWRRVFPKLPVLQKIYFSLTRGRNRAISLAEGLGRLYYCGFEIINISEINNFVFFIAKKINDPSSDKNPSYGPFFKMRRIGKNGKPFFVYKLRTMHPYAEYLQPFVYEHFNLEEGGKFKSDFRISYWGRIFRKLWIDELPMLINYFKRELKLVGVRPLSSHYLSLYTVELKEKRFKTKPGLVPPFYADMPATLDEIMDSENKYLDSYLKSPILTDFKYFFRAFNNIIFKHARSA